MMQRKGGLCLGSSVRRASTILGSLGNRGYNLQPNGCRYQSSVPFSRLNFVKPSVLEDLSVDHSDEKLQRTPRQVQDAFAAIVTPTPVHRPHLVSFSPQAAQLLDLDPEEIKSHPDAFADHFSGNAKINGTGHSYSHNYGGHQFGNWAGQLGDGRAITVGEIVNRRNERWEISLKGSGLTPFSRFADGRAVLRSSIREYLASEAMAALNIPTTRALSLVSSAEKTARDEFYNGSVKLETCAVVCRLAPTFIRFGSFEIFYTRGDNASVQRLADFVIKYHYPHLQDTENGAERYEKLFKEIIQRTAVLVSMWQSVGFAHGVLNTDNMSILGWTIDYGPYGFLDAYDPNFIPNNSDFAGRYRFANQPGVCKWNLAKLGQAILHLLPSVEVAQKSLDAFDEMFIAQYYGIMKKKLGLLEAEAEEGKDEDLVHNLLDLLETSKSDYTNTFRRLANLRTKSKNPEEEDDSLIEDLYEPEDCKPDEKLEGRWKDWLKAYRERLAREKLSDEERKKLMDSVNPKYILRNHLAQQAILEAEGGDYKEVNKLLDILSHPYDERPDLDARYSLPPVRGSPKICVSCSS